MSSASYSEAPASTASSQAPSTSMRASVCQTLPSRSIIQALGATRRGRLMGPAVALDVARLSPRSAGGGSGIARSGLLGALPLADFPDLTGTRRWCRTLSVRAYGKRYDRDAGDGGKSG